MPRLKNALRLWNTGYRDLTTAIKFAFDTHFLRGRTCAFDEGE